MTCTEQIRRNDTRHSQWQKRPTIDIVQSLVAEGRICNAFLLLGASVTLAHESEEREKRMIEILLLKAELKDVTNSSTE